MAEVFGVFGAQSMVVLVVAILGVVPVALYARKIPLWFVLAYGFLFVAAFATNFEDLLLPNLLNWTEHVVGNMGAGVAFALASYTYRKQEIDADAEPLADADLEG